MGKQLLQRKASLALAFKVILVMIISSSDAHADEFRFMGEPSALLMSLDAQNRPIGALVDIANALLVETGSQGSIVITPWARANEIALHEPNVILLALLKTPEREPLYQWIGQIHKATASVFRLKQNKQLNPTTLTQVQANVIGSVRGYGSAYYLRHHGFSESENLVLAKNPEQMWDLLYKGRVDFVLSNTETSPYEAAEAGYDPAQLVNVLDIPELTHELEFATGPGTSPANVRKLKKGLQDLKDKGVLVDIKRKWNISTAD